MRMSFFLIFILLLFARIYSQGNTEFRSVWVITWEHISSSSSVEENKARVRLILDNVKKANMNAVLWQARQSGTAYYNSAFEPYGYYAGYHYPGYDPLAYAIEEAHKRGLELHAWFNVFATSAMVPGAPAMEHPEWVCRDGYGDPMPASRCLSPGLEEVRQYTLNVAMEIVQNYDIDGLHLDYIRWNEYDRSDFTVLDYNQELLPEFQLDGMISQEKIDRLAITPDRERYLYDVQHPYDPANAPAGFGSWEDWWRWSVTEFVRVLHDSIQATKPWVRLSVAALGKYRWSSWQGYGTVFQDAALWFNEGDVDQLTPMHYHWTTGSEFYGMLVANGIESWGYWIQPGINSGRLYSVGPGSYRLSELNVWDNHPNIIQSCRAVPWVDGFQFFSYGSWRNHNYWETAKNIFFNGITKIRAATFLSNQTPPAPVLTGMKVNSQRYDIEVSPNEPLSIDQRFAIYRSEDDVLDVNSDEIITIHFGHEPFTYSDSISGLQNFNGRYTYFATRFDRYWNESAISNYYVSDSIPSFAPIVLFTQPQQGDTVPVNIKIMISFSKTMDTTSFTGNVIFDPDIGGFSLNWTSDQKQLTITPLVNLVNDVEYTLTIKKEVTDINGKELDGAANGGSSEDFILVFYTSALDIFPPRLIYSNPSTQVYTDNFDVQGIFSFAFDELLDHSSLQTTSTSVNWSGQAVPHKALIYDIEDRSAVCIQTTEPLYSGHNYQISLSTDLTDTSGNHLDTIITVQFATQPYAYSEVRMIDNFSGTGFWRAPGYSGSTNGVNTVASTFDISNTVYLPTAYTPIEKKSGRLHYVWDPTFLNPPGSEYLLREYLDDSPPRLVEFDTSYVLQCYILGDGSYNKFRFAVDDNLPATAAQYHEVSKWITIDWLGWRLIEWDLGDPESVGQWLGNGVLEGTLRIDSFQLTHDETGAMSGTLYFSNLRVIKKRYEISSIVLSDLSKIPQDFALEQNYPNPFNPVTTIPFRVNRTDQVRLTIYNVLGQEVAVLIDQIMQPGHYEVRLDATNLASGIYVYQLQSGGDVQRKRMMLLK